MNIELQQAIIKQIELRIDALTAEIEVHSAKLLAKSSVRSTKHLQTTVSDIAKLVDSLDVLDVQPLQPIARTKL